MAPAFVAGLRPMLSWLALIGALICLAALAARNLGLAPSERAFVQPRRLDLGLFGLALLALIFATRPTLLSVLALAPFVAAIASWAWAFGLRSASFVALIVACGGLAGFGGAEPEPLASLAIAATIASVAAIERERWAIAGGLLGYATIAASWPGLFALALAAKLALEPERRRDRGSVRALASFIGVGLVSALLPAHGVAASFGLAGPEPAGARAVGLRWLFALDGNLDLGPRWLDYPAKLEHLRERSGWLWACASALMVPVIVAARRLEPARFVAIAGCTSLLAFTSVDAQVWVVACVLLASRATLLRERPLTLGCAGLLALDLGLRSLGHVHAQPFLYNVGATSLLSLLLLGLGVVVLLVPDLSDEPGAPR